MNAGAVRNMLWLFFSFDGRVGQRAYFLGGLWLLVIQGYLVYRFIRAPEGSDQAAAWALMFTVCAVLALIGNLAMTSKRLQDIDRPPALALMYFLAGVLMWVYLCFIPGTPGPNRYGQTPDMPAWRLMPKAPSFASLYRSIDSDHVIKTAEGLERRIADRFPESGLRKVASELISLGHDITREARALEAPIRWLRVLIAAIVVLGVVIVAFVMTLLSFDSISTGAFDFVQGIEATLNTVLLVGLGLIALVEMELRVKRGKVFAGLHALRSVIHVIDMHQLTKDPAILSSKFTPTEHSPKRIMNAADLQRYLDYCSEMLSITGKLAALYAQSVNDDVVARAVNDVENLGSNLSRKIWQKIIIISDANRTRKG